MAIRTVLWTSTVLATLCVTPTAPAQQADSKCSGCGIAISEHGPQQFEIQILCAEVEPGGLRDLGLSLVPYKTLQGEYCLDGRRFRLSSESDAPPGFDVDSLMTTLSGAVESAEQFAASIRRLEQTGAARILASPTVVTLCGQRAELVTGGQYPITIRGADESFATQFIEFGERFRVHPTKQPGAGVRLGVCYEHALLDFDDAVVTDGELFPGLTTRRVTTNLDLRGDNLVFASLRPRTPSRGSLLGPLRDVLPTTWEPDHKQAADQPMVEFVVLIVIKPHSPVAQRNRAAVDPASTPPPAPAVILDVVPASLEQDSAEDCPECKPPGGLGSLLKRVSDLASLWLPAEFEIEIGAGSEPSRPCDRECCKSSEAIGADCPRPIAVLGGAVTRHDQAGPVHVPCPECIRQVQLELVQSDEEMEEDESDEDTVVFMEDVLRAQAQYLEEMMEARFHHEREKLEIKSAAESAVAKLTAQHAEALARTRAEQAAELVRVKEEGWEFERKLLEAHHRQAIEHERELAQLRREHMQELHAMRLAALQSEMATLRGSSPTKPAAASAMGESDPHASVRGGAASERPVADVRSSTETSAPRAARSVGRVRPMPDRQLDALQQTDFTDSVPPAPRPVADELEELRREVARLRALVEDLLCVGPGHPPTPVPQNASQLDASSESDTVRSGVPILR